MAPPLVVTYVIGGWTLGVLADLFLQGLVLGQVSHYSAMYGKDKWPIKSFVAGLAVLTTLKSIQSIVIIWHQNVEFFLDLDKAAGIYDDQWYGKANLTFVAIIAFYVQVFFVQRLYSVSSKKWAAAITLAFFLFALIGSFVVTAANFANDSTTSGNWIAIHLGTVLGGDILLTGFTAYFLLQHSKKVLPHTVGMLNAIIRLTFQSAAPAAVCALFNLIFSQVGSRSDTANAPTMLAIIFSMALPKLYAVSAMWTLNARRSIRMVSNSDLTGSSTEKTSNNRTGGTSGRRTNNLELNAISGGRIHIQTQVQTVQQFDRDDFEADSVSQKGTNFEPEDRGVKFSMS